MQASLLTLAKSKDKYFIGLAEVVWRPSGMRPCAPARPRSGNLNTEMAVIPISRDLGVPVPSIFKFLSDLAGSDRIRRQIFLTP